MPNANSIPLCTGFRVTGYDGREVWRQLHEAAERLRVPEFMAFFHNVVNFGLGKPLHGISPRDFCAQVQHPNAMPVAARLRGGTTMEDLRRAVVAIVARDEKLPCPHCRSHGLKWFNAMLDLVMADGKSTIFKRPAVMLHFIDPYRAYCAFLKRFADENGATPPAPPPGVAPCARSGRMRSRRPSPSPQPPAAKRPHASPPPEERPARPMVGIAPAEPRPRCPSRQSAVSAAEWRDVVPPAPVPATDADADPSEASSVRSATTVSKSAAAAADFRDRPPSVAPPPRPAPPKKRAAVAMGVNWMG